MKSRSQLSNSGTVASVFERLVNLNVYHKLFTAIVSRCFDYACKGLMLLNNGTFVAFENDRATFPMAKLPSNFDKKSPVIQGAHFVLSAGFVLYLSLSAIASFR